MNIDNEYARMYTPVQIRQIRAIDGVTYSLTALAVIFYFPDIFAYLPGTASFFSLLPIFSLAVATLFFPRQPEIRPVFHGPLLRLRFSSLMTAGLCPFIVWWLRVPDQPYFMAFSGIAVGVLGWYLLELLDFLSMFLQKIDRNRLVREAVTVRALLLYVFLVPFGTIFLVFFIARFFPGQEQGVLRFVRLWEFAPITMRLIMLLPPLMTLVVLWKSRKHFLAPEAQQRIFV